MKVKKNRKNSQDLNFFVDIIRNSLLRNKRIVAIFAIILVTLCISCIFEVEADSLLGKLPGALKDTSSSKSSAVWNYSWMYLFHILFGWTHNHLFSTNIHFIKSVMYKYLVGKYMHANLDSFNAVGTGKVCSVIHRQIESVIFVIKYVFLDLFYTNAYIGMFFYKLLSNDQTKMIVKQTYIMVYAASLMFIAYICWMAYKRKTRLVETEHANSHSLLDIFRNLIVVKAFNNEKTEVNKFGNLLKEQINLGYEFYAFEEFSSVLFKAILLMVMTTPVLTAELGIFKTTLSTDVVLSLFITFRDFKRNINNLKNCICKIVDKFAEVHSSTDFVGLCASERDGDNIIAESPQIDFVDLSIMLENRLVFSGLNMSIRPGEKVAITGRNGAGKSTTIKALMGMIEYGGEINVGNQNTSKASVKSLRDMISYVPQNPMIFNTTVMENLKYGKNISDEEVIQACMKCGVHEIFKGLENGYFTVVGENATHISGGQAQMVNFMRAIIKDAPIFLFDEPTSNLDFATSNMIIEKIFTVLKTKTVLLSTHSPHHLKNFDKIINITDKRCDLFDGYDEFMKNPGMDLRL